MTFDQTLKQALELRDTKGDLRRAQRLIDRLFSSYNKLAPSQKISLHKEMASLLRYKGELDGALGEYRKGLRLAKRYDDVESQVDLLRLIGFTTLKRFSTARARRWARRALSLLPRLSGTARHFAAANVWALVGNIESTDKKVDKAISAYRKGLKHARQVRFYPRIATLLGDLANKYIGLRKYREAEEALKEDARLSKKYHRHSYPNALVRLSYLYYVKANPRRNLKKAWEYGYEALRIAKKEGWGREIADAYQRLGKIAWYLGKNTESKHYLQQAHDQYKKVKHVVYAKWVKKVMRDLERGINSHHDYPQE